MAAPKNWREVPKATVATIAAPKLPAGAREPDLEDGLLFGPIN